MNFNNSVQNDFKKKMQKGDLLVGSWIQIGHPAIMEYMSYYDFDWLAVDLEHTDITTEIFANMLRGAANSKINIFARVKKNSLLDIRQVLDLGADGIIVPLVNNAKEAKEAVAAAKYSPEGERGFAFCRANGYGKNFDAYTQKSNDETVIIMMIESKEAVENIDEILNVPGVDGIFIGPYDLSGSYGVPGQTSSQLILNAIQTVAEACVRLKKVAGIHQVIPEQKRTTEIINQGFKFIALGMDNVFLGQGIETGLASIKTALNQKKDT